MSRDSRKKERQRLKRRQKKLAMRRVESRTALQRIAAEGGTLECWITPDWEEEGIAAIQVIGRAPGGRSATCGFLVDLWCVGLKDAFGRSNVVEPDFREYSLEPWIERSGAERVDAAVARRLVAGAIRFSRQNGFRLPPRWEKWITIFGRDILNDLATADISDFGVDGKLRYVGTMDFLRQRLIGCTVEEFARRPDVEVVIQSDGPGFGDDADEVDFEEGEPEEADSEDAGDDADDSALEPEAGNDEVLEAMELMSDRLTNAVRKWCFAGSITPHPRLAEAAVIALAGAIPGAASIEDGQGPESIDPAEAVRVTRELLSRFADNDRRQIVDAIGQVRQFMAQFSNPYEMLAAVECQTSGK